MLAPGKVKIAVGKVLKTHGIKGELNVELTDNAEPDEDFATGNAVIVEIDGLDVPYFVGSARPRGSESILLTFDDLTSDSEAAALVGHTLYVYVDPEEADDGLTAGELIGYTLIDHNTGEKIGEVQELTELTADAWYFQLDDGRLIPAVNEFIDDIDHEQHTVDVTLPEGLLEL